MKKRRTKIEINKLNAYATKVGLDGRLADLCREEYEVDKMFEIQEKMNEYSSGVYYYKIASPKEKTLEYDRAIGHKKALAEYLYNSGQLESLRILNDVTVDVNNPKTQNYIERKKEWVREELEILSFSKTRIKEAVKILMEYLGGKHQDKYEEFPPNSTLMKVAGQYNGKIVNGFSDDIDEAIEMKAKKALYDLSHKNFDFYDKHSDKK